MATESNMPDSDVFNPSIFDDNTAGLTMNVADMRYLRIGTSIICPAIDTGQLSINGNIVDVSSISGVTAGIVSASKAVIVDANKDITGFRNIASSGTASLNNLQLEGILSSSDGFWQSSASIQITGGSSPSGVASNGGGFRFAAINSTFYISSHNHFLSTTNNIDIGDGTLYVKADATVGIGNTAPAQKLHVTGNTRITGYVQIGTSTDTTRTISALDSTMANASAKYITLGKTDTLNNQAELQYFHTSDGSLSNKLILGLHSNPLVYIMSNGGIGISQPNPVYKLDVFGNANFTEEIRQDGLTIIDTSGVFVGGQGINTVGRIISSAPLGISQTNSGFSNAEARMYCGNGYAWFGNQNNSTCRLGTNGEDFIFMQKNGSRKATCIGGGINNGYPLSVEGTVNGEYSASGYGYVNSGGNTGTGSNTGAGTVAFYCDGRVLCRGEVDCISDLRRKENVVSIDMEYVDRFINNANPVSFNYKQESGKTSFGYIAQSLLKLGLDELINAHPNDTMEEMIDDDGFVSPAGTELSVTTGSIIPILHHKIKRMDTQIRDLLDRIDALEKHRHDGR